MTREQFMAASPTERDEAVAKALGWKLESQRYGVVRCDEYHAHSWDMDRVEYVSKNTPGAQEAPREVTAPDGSKRKSLPPLSTDDGVALRHIAPWMNEELGYWELHCTFEGDCPTAANRRYVVTDCDRDPIAYGEPTIAHALCLAVIGMEGEKHDS